MPRPNRSDIVHGGVPQHVIFRGNNRRRLYSYFTCYACFQRALGSSARQHGCLLHGAGLVHNHGHLLITPPSASALSKCMQRTLQIYAQHRNRMRDGSGKLFEERFKTFGIRDVEHLGRVSLYVDLNPYKAGVVAHPAMRSWSTYQLHAGSPSASLIDREIWTPSEFWLQLGANDSERREVYAGLARERMPAPLDLIDDDEHREAIIRAERASEPYTRRLERPDRTRVAEELDEYLEIRRWIDDPRGSPQER